MISFITTTANITEIPIFLNGNNEYYVDEFMLEDKYITPPPPRVITIGSYVEHLIEEVVKKTGLSMSSSLITNCTILSYFFKKNFLFCY
jgi:hypothetical protein